MSDRPTPPAPDAEPERPDETTPAPADDTAVLPQGAAEPDVPTAAEGAPGPESTGPAAYPAPGATPVPGVPVSHAAYGAPATAAAAPGGSTWHRATSTSGGRAAIAAGGVLALVVLAVAALVVGGLVWRVAGGGHHDRMAVADQRGPLSGHRGDGPGRSEDAPGQQRRNGDGNGRGNGNGNGNGFGPGRRGQGQDATPRMVPGLPGAGGMGTMRGNGLGGLGGEVLHGEFTAMVDGKATVMVVQTGEVTTYTSGQSLGVRSTDGFQASYALTGSTAPSRGAGVLATGTKVRVVAVKEGMKVTRVVVIA